MYQLILTLHVVIALVLIVLVLIQQGKGASMGTAFGSGASQTVFGSRGPAGFLLKLTGALAAVFFVTSLVLGYLAHSVSQQQDSLDLLSTSKTQPVTKPEVTLPPTSEVPQ
ncbi:MAG: preprotein translocase subunit SecG [Gammaproteobacteria bacterium]